MYQTKHFQTDKSMIFCLVFFIHSFIPIIFFFVLFQLSSFFQTAISHSLSHLLPSLSHNSYATEILRVTMTSNSQSPKPWSHPLLLQLQPPFQYSTKRCTVSQPHFVGLLCTLLPTADAPSSSSAPARAGGSHTTAFCPVHKWISTALKLHITCSFS